MSAPQSIASVTSVTTHKGAELRARREAIGISMREFAKRVGHSRPAITKIEAGESVQNQYEIIGAMDKVLSEIEHEFGMDLPSQVETIKAPTATEPGVVRVKVEGVYGAKALIVEAPPENIAELEAMVDRIMRRLQSDEGEGSAEPRP